MPDRLEQLRKLHAADPTDADVPYMIALELAKAGQTDEAIDWLDKCLSLDGDYLYAYYQKGQLLAERGDSDAARTALESGLRQAQAAHHAKATSELQDLLASITG